MKNVNVGDIKDFYCEVCIKGKIGWFFLLFEFNIRVFRLFELLYIDIWGLVLVVFKGGMWYFLIVYDDYSYWIFFILMRMKFEIL